MLKLKNTVFFFAMLSTVCVFSATYYVDAQSGNDSNNGLTTATAWKTMSKVSTFSSSPGFSAGDQILFKKGQVFSDYIYFRSSGSSGNPIVLGAYGTGNKPCLASMHSLTGFSVAGNWTDLGGNIWRMSLATDPCRVWLVGTEYVEANANAADPVALMDSTYRWYYNAANQYLYIWSPSNPAGYYASTSGLHLFQHELLFFGASYVTVQDLDFVGGSYGAICLANGSHDITIQNCKVRKSHHGILVQGVDAGWNSTPCYNIYIRNNEIDSEADYAYNYEYYNIGEGIYFRSGVTDSEISGNTLRDWGHSCINLYADTGEGIKRCLVFNNYCYGENISYCRGFGFNGYSNLCEDNEVYGNQIINTTVPNQINCSNLYFHDNVIDTVTQSPARSNNTGGQGLTIYITNTWPSANNNTVTDNTIIDCADVGIAVWNTSSSAQMTGNVIQGNTVTNCGLNVQAWRTHLSGMSMEITETVSGSINYNQFSDNELSDTSTYDVYYKGSSLTVSGFNLLNGDDNNTISGNY